MSSYSTSSLQRVAHRGGSAFAPENTLAAFRQALSFPIDALELDVHMSCDGHVIVFHDETVERLTNGQGNILDLDLAYLRSLDAATHFPGGWPQPQHIPTLREVLRLVQPERVRVYIEIKSGKRNGTYSRYPGIAESVAREVLAADMLERVLVMAFDWGVLSQIKALAPALVTGALVSEDVWQSRAPEALSTLIAQVKALQCEWVHMDRHLFTPDMPGAFHASGLRLGIWTVNDAVSLQHLAQTGVDALTTDRPDLFAAIEK
ncbi:MAG TPA: glycerophosphodiester phosphodiesterase family protein [Ktedonobacteraceae bacterium]|nr:glycerophosphodiester phosphodiesterase family protein [Ktedonobacteraceae bacterium]